MAFILCYEGLSYPHLWLLKIDFDNVKPTGRSDFLPSVTWLHLGLPINNSLVYLLTLNNAMCSTGTVFDSSTSMELCLRMRGDWCGFVNWKMRDDMYNKSKWKAALKKRTWMLTAKFWEQLCGIRIRPFFEGNDSQEEKRRNSLSFDLALARGGPAPQVSSFIT